MKFLPLPVLSYLTSRLTGIDTGDGHLNARLEAYSCCTNADDKKLFKTLHKQYEELSSSPIFKDELSMSPFGPLAERTSRSTFINLISTLNCCFPDYDFGAVQPIQFTREQNFHSVANYINSILNPIVPEYSDLGAKLWSSLEAEMKIMDCEMFSYIPEPDADPFNEEGIIWCFNYFFYNKKQKKVLFFMCKSVSKTAQDSMQTQSDDDDASQWGWDMEVDDVDYL
eukprot:TRINITY_DN21752_c0_g1_i1.p1 TRINITY_DN21752_c0_g1~~TRINITY_DN21752_c0_g1_i1.p1  ORF type:complete len:226 (+),score=28.44 TRINITY_DN21752_c0_g1_i1:116-793(+)